MTDKDVEEFTEAIFKLRFLMKKMGLEAPKSIKLASVRDFHNLQTSLLRNAEFLTQSYQVDSALDRSRLTLSLFGIEFYTDENVPTDLAKKPIRYINHSASKTRI